MKTAEGNMTIFALASGSGKAGIAVFRVSGPNAVSAYTTLSAKPAPKPRQVTRTKLYHPKSKELLDDGLAIYFAGPASFTGEDVVEIHSHGGTGVGQKLRLQRARQDRRSRSGFVRQCVRHRSPEGNRWRLGHWIGHYPTW